MKQTEIVDDVRRRNLLLDLQSISTDAGKLGDVVRNLPVLKDEIDTVSTIRHYLNDLFAKYESPLANESKNVTGKTLQAMIAAVRLTPDKFAVSIDVKPSQLRRFLKKSTAKPIKDKIFLMKLVAYAPNVILSRIEEMNRKLQELQQFSPILQKVGQDLQAMEKQEEREKKWEEKFGDKEETKEEQTHDHTNG